MVKAAVIFAEGFEEIEAVTPVDVLCRAGVEVITAGLTGTEIRGAHGVTMKTDTVVSELKIAELDVVILPGGMPGSEFLAASEEVQALLKSMLEEDKKVAAICAAPMAFDSAGILGGRKYTCYPGVENKISAGVHVDEKVVVDGNIISSQGPGTALLFSFTILKELGLIKEAKSLAEGMLAG